MSELDGAADDGSPTVHSGDDHEGVLRVPLAALAEGRRTLETDAARYVTRVHRLAEGESFLAFDPARAEEAEALIVSVGRRTIVAVAKPRPSKRVPNRRLTVVQTASKGSKIDDVLRDATELGVTRFVVAQGERSVRRPDAESAARWRRVAEEAARQCGRGDMPIVAGPIPLVDAMREPADLRWLLDPRGEPPRDTTLSEAKSAIVLVGPEGGFSPGELTAATELGFARVKLGEFVLRTETACAAALGALRGLGFR